MAAIIRLLLLLCFWTLPAHAQTEDELDLAIAKIARFPYDRRAEEMIDLMNQMREQTLDEVREELDELRESRREKGLGLRMRAYVGSFRERMHELILEHDLLELIDKKDPWEVKLRTAAKIALDRELADAERTPDYPEEWLYGLYKTAYQVHASEKVGGEGKNFAVKHADLRRRITLLFAKKPQLFRNTYSDGWLDIMDWDYLVTTAVLELSPRELAGFMTFLFLKKMNAEYTLGRAPIKQILDRTLYNLTPEIQQAWLDGFERASKWNAQAPLEMGVTQLDRSARILALGGRFLREIGPLLPEGSLLRAKIELYRVADDLDRSSGPRRGDWLYSGHDQWMIEFHRKNPKLAIRYLEALARHPDQIAAELQEPLFPLLVANLEHAGFTKDLAKVLLDGLSLMKDLPKDDIRLLLMWEKLIGVYAGGELSAARLELDGWLRKQLQVFERFEAGFDYDKALERDRKFTLDRHTAFVDWLMERLPGWQTPAGEWSVSPPETRADLSVSAGGEICNRAMLGNRTN